ncbi:MAG: ABC transporter permease [Bdellovibrionales bacterium]|nr:ABC transporter permease [Bdellovibrionales bacterium]
MTVARVAIKSLLSRKVTTVLTILSIALSVSLLLGIERVRTAARSSFESTVSGVDLIVGARSGPVNLLLYSVFRIGNATNNISFESFDEWSRHKNVDWTIPISLGDSHKGYRVVGTNQNYFRHYMHSGSQKLKFSSGQTFEQLFDVVIGAEIAERLKYSVGDRIVLSHGSESVAFQDHYDKPFTIVGVLKKTGTPVDKSLHISLKALRALHLDWQSGAPPRPGEEVSVEEIVESELVPSDVTAFFVKLKSRIAVFKLQREINNYQPEALMAILPGITLRDLWQTLGTAENALLVVSAMVFFVSLIGMLIALLSTLNERRREMAILRSVGAKKGFIFTVLVFETTLLTASGIALGVSMLYFGLIVGKPILETKLGLSLGLMAPSNNDFFYLISIFGGGLVASIVPAWRAYRNSLGDGLTIRR